MDVYECVFILGMLAWIRTPKASHELYHWMSCRIGSSCMFSGAVWAAKYDPPLKGMSNEFEPVSNVTPIDRFSLKDVPLGFIFKFYPATALLATEDLLAL